MKKRYIALIIILIAVINIILLSIFFLTHINFSSAKLVAAVRAEDVNAVKALLDKGIDPNQTDKKSSWIWTMVEDGPERPLSVACEKGNIEIAKMLIDYGATAEYIADTGWSPLMHTILCYHDTDVEMVELMLQSGADPDYIESGYLPAFMASRLPPFDVEMNESNKIISENYNENSASNITEIVIMLLGEKSVNIQDEGSEMTLLMVAAKAQNAYLVEYLLSVGSDVSIKDCNGKKALDYAYEANDLSIISILEEHQRND